MRRLIFAAVCAGFVTLLALPLAAQTRSTSAKKPLPRKPAPSPARVTGQPQVICPAILGAGVKTRREFCDVQVGRDPGTGIIIRFPPHKGPLVLTFDLHNREMYSEQLVREKRAFVRHVATIGVLTLDGGLLTRAVVETEFRNANDVLDRVNGGAGPTGVKAVVPVGTEPIRVEIPEGVDAVSVLGEKLLAATADASETIVAPGRPIAVISNVTMDYRPAPAAKKTKAPAKTPARKK
jgi:hypothetical protein